jgi:hypothetical protein
MRLVIDNEDGNNDGEKKVEKKDMKPYASNKALNEANKR